MKGFVREIFSSVQGEGIRLGTRQTFIRFLGCNLSCNYCDIPECQKLEGNFIYEKKIYNNPVEDNFLMDKLFTSEISITGGEPLLQIEFLSALCDKLKKSGKRIYLDTNGSLPNELKKVIQWIDFVALDFKIPTATGRPSLWNEHRECLKIASNKNVFVKIVINENFLPKELDKCCEIIESIDKAIPLVIQPVFGRKIPNILDIQKEALKRLLDVRIIPQVHKYLNLP